MAEFIYQMYKVRKAFEGKVILDDVTMGFYPGAWHWFEGNFDDYQKDREKRLGPDLSRPHRLHRKLTRD